MLFFSEIVTYYFFLMNKVYYLSTCSTCTKIMQDAGISGSGGFELQDIKIHKITPAQLQEMKNLAGSYEALFSRKAQKYRELGLHNKKLTEKEYADYILQGYTFLKRPVVIIRGAIFIGNEKQTIAKLKEACLQPAVLH